MFYHSTFKSPTHSFVSIDSATHRLMFIGENLGAVFNDTVRVYSNVDEFRLVGFGLLHRRGAAKKRYIVDFVCKRLYDGLNFDEDSAKHYGVIVHADGRDVMTSLYTDTSLASAFNDIIVTTATNNRIYIYRAVGDDEGVPDEDTKVIYNIKMCPLYQIEIVRKDLFKE